MRPDILFIFLLFLCPTKLVAISMSSALVIEKFPHDKDAFTQGLEYHDGVLYEGTGLWGSSELRKVELETGRVIQTKVLAPKYFGEGITILQDKVFQLTWKSGKGFVYDLDTFDLIRDFSIPGEGWGLTNNGKNLILSNGSDQILFLDIESLQFIKSINVKKEGKPQYFLNELEYVENEIWANVWKTDQILRINPSNGEVIGILDLSIISEKQSEDDVANGIAWDAQSNRIFVTGKFWNYIYQIEQITISE